MNAKAGDCYMAYVHASEDIPGEWVVHVLGPGVDLVTQGSSPTHAFEMAGEALALVLDGDQRD